VNNVNCREWMEEIVEGARAGYQPRSELAAHIERCAGCRELQEAEQTLAEPVRRLRAAVGAARSPEYRKHELLQEFGRARRPAQRFNWAFSAAASVLLALAAGLMWRTTAPVAERAAVDTVSTEATDSSEFAPVPYAPPLASGEMVTVVRTELHAAALDRMGFVVPGMSGNDFQAEVMLGQDGLPRAVRVLADQKFEN
jgi:hypothetical protein